jgi:hypothetical protein
MYRQMVRIRTFEDNANQLYLSAKMPGLTHMYSGEEAVAVGICEALTDEDRITSTHRGHGHCVAKGAEFKEMFCELLGKEEGYCRGKGGSMHIADQSHGNLGANAIVGGSMGIATGAALSAKLQGKDDVTVCFFGDGATAQGLWYEVMNMAALWNLPVIYACENNGYSEYTKTEEIAAGSSRPAPRPSASRPRGRRAGRAGGQRPDDAAGRALPQGRRPVLHGADDLPLSRPPRRRHQPRILPLQGRGSGLEGRTATRSPTSANGWKTEGIVRRGDWRPSTPRSRPTRSRRRLRAERALSGPSEVDMHVLPVWTTRLYLGEPADDP